MTTWFDYSERERGTFAAMVSARLTVGKKLSSVKEFVIDSGSSFSLAPSWFVSGIDDDFFSRPEEDTPLRDAHGKPIKGRPIDVVVNIENIPSFSERMWFSKDFHFGLLGQTWFENIVVTFHNFPISVEGRRFGFDLPIKKGD
jgi:hypothetical protein